MISELKKNKKLIIYLVTGFIAIFLGSFFAFFIVFEKLAKDYNFVSLGNVNVSQFMVSPEKAFDEFDKQFNKRIEELNKHNQFFSNMREFRSFENIDNEFSFINMSEDKNKYLIKLNLKPFNNNEKNIDIKTKNNRVIITANYKDKKDKNISSSSFYQSLNLSDNINDDQIQKTVKDGILTIIINKK